MVEAGTAQGYERQAGKYLIRCTGSDLEPGTTRFVARTYYYDAGFTFDKGYPELLDEMLEEDRRLRGSSVCYTIYDSEGLILGTATLVILRDNLRLPVEKEFAVDLEKVILERRPVQRVMEICRLAVRENRFGIMRLLFLEAIAGFEKDDLLLAAIDSRVLRHLNRVGFCFSEIGEARHYRGSLTHPVAQMAREIRKDLWLDR